jgi:colicin import membrane protein
MAEPETAPGGTEAPKEPKTEQPKSPAAEPSWLNPRLEQAERSGERKALERLGLSEGDIEKAKAALAAARKAEEDAKTADQRAAEAAVREKTALTRLEQAEATNKEHAARMMAVLSEDKQAAVKQIAGEDPALQLRAIHALGPTWAAQAEATKKLAAAEKEPATTAPPPNAPGGTDPKSPPDHRAIYESLKDNPFARAAYGVAHPEAYQPRK